jgi:hypothetical protein
MLVPLARLTDPLTRGLFGLSVVAVARRESEP